MKKILVILITGLLFNTLVLGQEMRQGASDEEQYDGLNESEAVQPEDNAEIPSRKKLLLGLNVGAGAGGSSMPSGYESYIVSYDSLNTDPESKIVTVYQVSLDGYYFIQPKFALKFGIGYVSLGAKQGKDYSDGDIFFKQTGFNYIQFHVAPAFVNEVILWCGLTFGIKVGTPQYTLYDSWYYEYSGNITTANSAAAGITVGVGYMLKSGNIYFPMTIEFVYHFTKSGLRIPNGEQNQRLFALYFNIGILFQVK